MADTKTAQSGLKEELPEQRHIGDVRPLGNVPGPRVSYKPLERVDSGSGISYLSGMYTSPAEEERLRKASVQRQRIMAVGDALRHLGNIYYTSRYAPAQRFSNPVEEERVRYLRDKGERDKDNVRFMSYQQAKAQQDYRISKLRSDTDRYNELNEYRREQNRRLANKLELDERKQEWLEQYQQGVLDAKDVQLEIEKAYKEGLIDDKEKVRQINWFNAQTRRMAVNKGSSGYTTTTTSVDPLTGNKVTKTTTKTPGGGSSPSVGWDDNESGPSVGW